MFQAPENALHDAWSVLHKVRHGRHEIIYVVDNRHMSVLAQKTILRRRHVAVTPDMRKREVLMPPQRTQFAVGKLKSGDHAAREKRRQKWPDTNLAEFEVR